MSDGVRDMSDERFFVHYRISQEWIDVERIAQALCLDQTVELSADLVPEELIAQQIVGRIEHIAPCPESQAYEAVISFATKLVKHDICQLLNVIFGMCSLNPLVRVVHLEFPSSLSGTLPGARFGLREIRHLVECYNRPLVCGVLKPLGLSSQELARLAAQFAAGGLDMIKDDQALADQPWCRFEERVARCAEAVNRVNRETGRRCLYFVNVTGPCEMLSKRCRFAKDAGASGLLMCPGLMGFDALRQMAHDARIALPVMSHPAFLGSFIHSPAQGIAPSVLFGELPRALGADISVYPLFGGPYGIDRMEWIKTTEACTRSWGSFRPICPTVAGRLQVARISEIRELGGDDCVYIVGGELQRRKDDIVGMCQRLLRSVRRDC
ncbi:MAG: ribulose 1,5-bisphosphate carboxylase large subunit [Nitrospirae bacterium]|nr:MAG: ribulose 1,5-bisphosphate carboxylase large subunit [Nitrospirota bacterium]